MPNYPAIDPLDWNSVQPHVDALLAAELTPANARHWLQTWSDLASVLDEAITQTYRAVSENTADKAADVRFTHVVSAIIPKATEAEQALKQKLLALTDYTPPSELASIFRRFQAEAAIFHTDNVPIFSELSLLDKQYDEIVGGLSIDWQGESKTLPQVELLLGARDRTVRERAWRLAADAYLDQRGKLNDLFMQMLPKRRQIAQNAGFDGFRSYRWPEMGRFGYTPADCMSFHDAIEHEVVPFATELYAAAAAELGLDRIRPWDMGLSSPWQTTVDPQQTPLRPFDTIADLEAGAQRIFDQVDPLLGGYFTAMRDGYLDLESRPHKAPGGYCSSLPVSGQPYIFMNAAGSHRNLRTLLHEGGHAFHVAESIRSQSLLWNYNGPMEFCEVASMAMELLSMPYWSQEKGGFYAGDDLNRAIAEQLRGIVFFFPYMAVVDALQHWLYVDAPAAVSTADINAKWSELWDRFMPGADYGNLQAEKETGWHRKGHIFGAPFYYIEYGLAQLGALQVWRNALDDQTGAVAAYRRALSAGHTRTLPELFSLAGATFAFDRKTVGELMGLVRKQLDAVT